MGKLQKGIAQLIKGNSIQFSSWRSEKLPARRRSVLMMRSLKLSIVLIATGSRTSVPPIPGIELAMTSDQVLQWDRPLPQQAVIIGAGVIGLEFA